MKQRQLASASIMVMIVLGGLLISLPYQNEANADTHIIDLAATSDLVRDPFGYITGQGAGDESVHIDILPRIRSDLVLSDFQFNTVELRPTSITQTEAYNAVVNGETAWESASEIYTRQPEFGIIDAGDNNMAPSLFDTTCTNGSGTNNDGVDNNDNIFQMGFCDMNNSSVLGETRWWPTLTDIATAGGVVTGGYVNLQEVDMIFNNEISWTSAQLQNVATHELGHSYGLGDLYSLHGTTNCYTDESAFAPSAEMCNYRTDRAIGTGDTDGLFYLYPFSESLSITESFTARAIDVAAHSNIQGSPTTSPELVLVEVDFDSTNNRNYFRLKPFEITNANSYSDNPGVQETLMWGSLDYISGSAIKDVGAAFGNVDKSADQLDLVIVWIDSTNNLFYRTLFDVTESSENLTWTSDSGSRSISGEHSTAEAVDAVFMGMDTASETYTDEFVIFSSHYDSTAGSDVLDFYWMDLPTTATSTTITNWHATTNTGITIEDDAIGAGVINNAEHLAFVSYNGDDTSTPEFMAYKVIAFTTSGTVDEVSQRKHAPLDDTSDVSATLDGVGADALNFAGVTGGDFSDLIFLHVDNNAINFVVERDSRFGSHGSSDDW